MTQSTPQRQSRSGRSFRPPGSPSSSSLAGLPGLTYATLVACRCANPGLCIEKTAHSRPNLPGLNTENTMRFVRLTVIMARC